MRCSLMHYPTRPEYQGQSEGATSAAQCQDRRKCRFEANEKVCFSSEEIRYLDGIEKLAEDLGYDRRVGQIFRGMRVL